MSKNIIRNKDLKILAWLQNLLMQFVMSDEQKKFLETAIITEKSPAWNKTDDWNKNFLEGINAAMIRLHDILNALKHKKTKYHISGLTSAELFQLATAIGIPREKAETKKALLWKQIKCRMSPDLSNEELKWIFWELSASLKENEIDWLRKNGSGIWENADLKSKEWVATNTKTITDLEILIEDIISMTENKIIYNRHTRLTKADILAIEKRAGIIPPTPKIFSKGLIKARILKKIQDDIFLRRSGIIDTIPQTWGIV